MGVCRVSAFRFYVIDGSQRIVDATALDCSDDAEAIAEARKLLAERVAARGVEVWDRARRVAQLTRE